jgi:hypothetical protein
MNYRIKIYTITTNNENRYIPQKRKHWWNKWSWDYISYKTPQEAIDKINEWKEIERDNTIYKMS